MDHRLLARLLLSLLCGIQGIATVLIDLNRTHATNPKWARHARFHVVWQTLTMALLAVLEVGLLWGNYLDERHGFYLAALLATLSPAAFLGSWAGQRWFDGALSDTNGIQPAHLIILGRLWILDLNLIAVVAAILSLAAMIALYAS